MSLVIVCLLALVVKEEGRARLMMINRARASWRRCFSLREKYKGYRSFMHIIVDDDDDDNDDEVGLLMFDSDLMPLFSVERGEATRIGMRSSIICF